MLVFGVCDGIAEMVTVLLFAKGLLFLAKFMRKMLRVDADYSLLTLFSAA